MEPKEQGFVVRSQRPMDIQHARILGPMLVDNKISHGAVRLYGLFAILATAQGGWKSWYTAGALGKLLGADARTIYRWRKELSDSGLIQVDSGKEDGSSSVVTLLDETKVYGEDRCVHFFSAVKELLNSEIQEDGGVGHECRTGSDTDVLPGTTLVTHPVGHECRTEVSKIEVSKKISKRESRVAEPAAPDTGQGTSDSVPGKDPRKLHVVTGGFATENNQVLRKTALKFPEKVWMRSGTHPDRLFRHFSWRMSQEPRFGGAGIGEPDGKAAKLLDMLFKDPQLTEESGIELAMEMVDCLVMDWNAIKGIKSLKALVPDVGLLWTFRNELKVAVLSGDGMVNQIHRSSRWAAWSPKADMRATEIERKKKEARGCI